MSDLAQGQKQYKPPKVRPNTSALRKVSRINRHSKDATTEEDQLNPQSMARLHGYSVDGIQTFKALKRSVSANRLARRPQTSSHARNLSADLTIKIIGSTGCPSSDKLAEGEVGGDGQQAMNFFRSLHRQKAQTQISRKYAFANKSIDWDPIGRTNQRLKKRGPPKNSITLAKAIKVMPEAAIYNDKTDSFFQGGIEGQPQVEIRNEDEKQLKKYQNRANVINELIRQSLKSSLGVSERGSVNNRQTSKKQGYRTPKNTYFENISDSSSNSSDQYIGEATPGPGAYEIPASIVGKASKNKGKAPFGATDLRFHSSKSQSYLSKLHPKLPEKHVQSRADPQKMAFGSVIGSKEPKSNVPVSPFYENCRSLENLAQKLKKKYTPTKQRILNGTRKTEPGQGLITIFLNKPFNQTPKTNRFEVSPTEPSSESSPQYMFKSETMRMLTKNSVSEPRVFYAQEQGSIKNKLEANLTKIKDHAIQKPAFNEKAQRFKQLHSQQPVQLATRMFTSQAGSRKDSKQIQSYSFSRQSGPRMASRSVEPGQELLSGHAQWAVKTFSAMYH